MRAPQYWRTPAAYWLSVGAFVAGMGLAAVAGGSAVAQAEPAQPANHAHAAGVVRKGADSSRMVAPAAASDQRHPTRATALVTPNLLVAAGARRAAAVGPVPVADNQTVPYADWAQDRHLFTGHPSILATLAAPVLRLVGPIERFATSTPPWFTTIGLRTTQNQSQGMAVWTLSGASPSGKYVVAIHGGGYRSDPTPFHWLTYAAMARKTGATVVVPMYPLVSQGGTAQTVVPEMTDFLTSMVSQYGSDNVSVIGDSAGGGLALAAVQEMVRAGTAPPGHMVLLSPWLDIALSDPAIQLIDDPVASALIPGLKSTGQSWAGSLAVTDPWVSPLYGSLQRLPPTTVYAGSRDVAAADALRLRDQAIAQGVDIRFVLRAGEFHDWPISTPLPDAINAMQAVYRQLGISRSRR
jgi:triacylglycerol lipase